MNREIQGSETPIDKLAEDVKLATRLIKDLGRKLKQVDTEVRDEFKKLDREQEQGQI